MATSRPRARRGSALILVLLMTLAIAGLSIAAIFLSSSQLRLRHRDAVESLMPEGQPVKLRLPRFRFVSRRIDRHSRLRLVIRAPACAFMQKNLNTATPVHLQQPQEARVARIEILHSREHPSVLRVPVCGEP